MKDTRPVPQFIRFESFEVNLRSGEVSKGGQRIKLPEQSFQILVMLLERPREVVMRAEIQKKLWPNDTVVEFDNSIHAAIRRLRVALGDPADSPRYIETLTRRGYRWMLPVERMEVDPRSGRGQLREGAAHRADPVAPHPIGKKVSHYRLLQVLGGGGMGIVYAAEDLKLGRRVALKFLPEELSQDSAAMGRLQREARAASSLNHPNICTIYGVEEEDGRPFIVMEMLEGQTLRELIADEYSQNTEARQSRSHWQGMLDLALQVVEGLDAAHKRGIIHRDIKPANVFVTPSGRVKILDFGLAKQQSEPESMPSADNNVGIENEANLQLTRTGATLGTAGYMSPEQIRGEKLDARTDLFSFGLVLYEMAAGQRAFTAETAGLLHEAILHQTPPAVRELNPQPPSRLQAIIDKALQKDRSARYQTAADIRNDLQLLTHDKRQRYSVRRLGIGLAVALLFIASLSLWLVNRSARNQAVPPEIKLRQLTSNSAENHVLSGTISVDGRYLAYSDIKGLHVKLLESGEIRDLGQPQSLHGRHVEWECIGWFPNGTQLLANAHPVGIGPDWYSSETSIWVFPIAGETAHMLRADAAAYAISPDGSKISFGTSRGRFGDREIWLMGPTGDQAYKLYGTDENHALGQNGWSPNGTRIIFPQIDADGVTLVTRDLENGPVLTVFTASEMKGINSFLWLPDGRLVYSLPEPGAIASTTNFWIMRLDEEGKPVDKPRRLTNLTEFGMVPTNATQDGKHLAFLRWAFHATVYLSELRAGGSRIGDARHLTLTESQDIAADWTSDSKAIILLSNRSGHAGIYRQPLDSDTPDLVVQAPNGLSQPRVSPDGKWVLYLAGAKQVERSELMRVSITGGTAERVFLTRSASGPLCARAPSNLCVIAEMIDDGTEFGFRAFDPIIGRSDELRRVNLDPNTNLLSADLSPAGDRVAVVTNPEGPIRLFSPRGEATGAIRAAGLNRIEFIHWSSDGRGIYVATGEEGGRVLWYVNLKGVARQLWKNRGGNWAFGIPSPDGRYLAIESSNNSQNMWMMENF